MTINDFDGNTAIMDFAAAAAVVGSEVHVPFGPDSKNHPKRVIVTYGSPYKV